MVTRKSSRWKSETASRKPAALFWDRYVARLWKSWGRNEGASYQDLPHSAPSPTLTLRGCCST